MADVGKEKQDEIEAKSEEDDEEIDIIGIKAEDLPANNDIQELLSNADDILPKNDSIEETELKLTAQNSEIREMSSENTEKESLNPGNGKPVARSGEANTKECLLDSETELLTFDIGLCKDDAEELATNISTNNDNESSVLSESTSASSSRVSSRKNSQNDSETSQSVNEDFDVKVSLYDGLDTQTPDDDDDDDDNDETKVDPYQRFFFESDYLALKDNKHYHLLLQTLVALEGQRVQAIKDLDTLCIEEAKALDDPIGFVEKLQNNVPLGLPSPQNVIKLPKIPWESYASSFGPLDMSSLSVQHNTRAASSCSTDKATHEPQPAVNLFNSEAINSNLSETIFSEAVKNNIPGKLPTFNQPWTIAEQTRLEKLLQVFPQEDIEAKRWEKIAKALGNRTPKQVASRVQKYFIKLAKAGLPIPGRVPNIPRSGPRTGKRASHYQTMGFRNSTFFPSYQPRVYMNDKDDDESSVAFSDDTSYLSDDESIPDELKQTREYMELLDLKKIKRQKLKHGDQASSSHAGFMCDGCGTDPIVGTRWHCQDCPLDTSLDFCSSCIDRGIPELRGHSQQHRFEPITKAVPFYVDGDYVGNTGPTGTGYNYLDPNFLPAAS